MNGEAQRMRHTVQQQMEAARRTPAERLDAVEPLVETLIQQDQHLLAAGQELAGRVQALSEALVTLRDQFEACQRTTEHLRRWSVELEGVGVWRRLRWVLTGVLRNEP